MVAGDVVNATPLNPMNKPSSIAMKFSAVIFSPIIILVALLMPSTARGEQSRQQISDSLRTELAKATTVTDSLQILNNLFDLARYDDRARVGEELFNISHKHFDLSTQLDIIRRLASVYASSALNSERIAQLTDLVASMPQSEDQRATLAFLRVQLVVSSDRNLSESERQKRVHELIKNRGLESLSDPYDRIELLFIICRYLQNDVNGELLSKYLDELGSHLDELSNDNIPLRNLYLVQASMVYTISGQREKAIKASRDLLETIDNLDKRAKASGLKYRNYDVHRYIAYRRLLTNYPSLSESELEDAYSKLIEITQRNSDTASDFEKNQRPQIYYLMAKRNYQQALEILKKQIDNPNNKAYLTQLYPFMIEAAQAVNDRDATLKASLAYVDLLKSMVDERALERSNELQVLEEMHNISGSNSELQARQREQAEGFHRQLLTFTIIASIILISVIIALFVLYRKAAGLTVKLAASNDELTAERDNLTNAQNELIAARDHARRADRHKTEFINNMSHEIRTPLNALVECSHLIVDNVPEEKRRYLSRYADMIDVSADMLRSIVNDVLEIAAMDNNSDIQISNRQESVNAICSIAVESVKKHCQPGVVMEYVKPDDTDLTINTDAGRVEQVLINLLSNGAKFTEHGYVRLSYYLNPDEHTITFSVEDTGIGVPKGKEEIIFERFEKLSNLTSGTGLGLNICRMVAKRLHGTVSVDTTYPGPGARFLFTLPLG